MPVADLSPGVCGSQTVGVGSEAATEKMANIHSAIYLVFVVD